MGRRRVYLGTFSVTLVVLSLAACSGPTPEPTAAPTVAPPTATLMLALPTAAPTPEPPTPSPPSAIATPTPAFALATSLEQVAGNWQKTMGAGCIRFDEDGTLRQARRRDTLDDRPFAIYEIWFEGTQLCVGECTVSAVPPCRDFVATYEVRLLERGRIEIVAIDDDCSPRRLDTATVYGAAP